MTETPPTPYRIGWWTLRWWPHPTTLAAFVRGRQPGEVAPGSTPPTPWGLRRIYLAMWLRDLRRLHRPHRPWQAEIEGARFARRAFTPQGAVRKIVADVEHEVLTGHPSPHQRRMVERALARRAATR